MLSGHYVKPVSYTHLSVQDRCYRTGRSPNQEVTEEEVMQSVIYAEHPEPVNGSDRFEIVKTNMIQGARGSPSYKSPCIKDGQCTNGVNLYPIYRRSSLL